MINNFQIQPNIDQSKLQTHLAFIDSFGKWCHQQNWRLVVYGGYGLDGYLQTITRNHGDVDLVMYGRISRPQALEEIFSYLDEMLKEVEIKSKEEDFLIDIKVKSKSISGNFYYVQVATDPFTDLSNVIKADGSMVNNSTKDFPPPVTGKLGDFDVEVQDQSAHLGDILRKRSVSDVLAKHDQDLENLKFIVQT